MGRPTSPLLLLMLAAAIGAAERAAADALAPGPDDTRVSFITLFDNDLFVDQDNYYTNGVTIGVTTGRCRSFAESPLPTFIGAGLDALPRIGDLDRHHHLSFTLSHRIFTPDDTDRSDLIRDDMPYSAIATADLVASTQDRRVLDAYTFSLGLVGPAALGEEIQNGAHHLFGVDEAQGWDHQLENEALVNVFYEHRRRWWRAEGRAGSADVIVGGTVAAGNLISSVDAALTFRYGYHLPDDFHTEAAFFANPAVGTRPDDASYDHRIGCYLFAHANASLVGNVIIWDGNTFRDSHSVDYDHYLVRGVVGLRFLWRSMRLSVTGNAVSIPFEPPDGEDVDVFGRVTFNWLF